jgi:heat shock protein HtpX
MFGNWLKTAMLMAAIVALFMVIGQLIGGKTGMIIALIFAGAMNMYAYWFSDKLVLRMYRAKPVGPGHPLYEMVADLAARANLPTPQVYIIPEDQPNAFATGRNPENAAVAATEGILELLSPRELRGVLAHELAHVKNRDTLISTISATIAGAISALANIGMIFGGSRDENNGVNPFFAFLLLMLAPLAATIIQFAISRAREFGADAEGAQISSDPEALASALEKIERYARGLPMSSAEHHPETAQMMIINPLSGASVARLFSTHPPTEERIRRLRALAMAAA